MPRATLGLSALVALVTLVALGALGAALVGCSAAGADGTTTTADPSLDAAAKDSGALGPDADEDAPRDAMADGTRSDTGGPAPDAGATGTVVARKAGARAYKLFVPGGRKEGEALPLVVMLHGCNQTPDDFAAGTRMNDVGERRRWLVAYPEQSSAQQPYQCWQWYEPAHQKRGAGEPASLAAVVADVKATYGVGRVYAAGLSAGAAMTVILGATYPDVFSAIAVHSGLEYGAASSASGSLGVLKGGGPSPDAQGDAAWAAMGGAARVVPTLVLHGTADAVVAPVNGTQVAAQWVRTNDHADDGIVNGSLPSAASATSSGASGGRAFQSAAWKDKSGAVIVQSYVINGLPHAWSGGDPAGTWTETGPSATTWVEEFFAAR